MAVHHRVWIDGVAVFATVEVATSGQFPEPIIRPLPRGRLFLGQDGRADSVVVRGPPFGPSPRACQIPFATAGVQSGLARAVDLPDPIDGPTRDLGSIPTRLVQNIRV